MHPNRQIHASRLVDKRVAVGVTVAYLQRSSVFRNQRFGSLIGTVIGQVERDHYLLFWQDGRLVGVVGWGYCSYGFGQSWLSGTLSGDPPDYCHGSCALINVLQVDYSNVLRFMRQCLLTELSEVEWVFAERMYEDGRTRQVKFGFAKNNR